MTPDSALELAQMLADVAENDTEYRDIYLRRAHQIVDPIISLQALDAVRAERARHAKLREEANQALDLGDWERVRNLARELSGLEARLAATAQLVTVAEKVYGAGTNIEPHALGAYLVSPLSSAELERAQQRTATQLEQLAKRDEPWRALYATRRTAIATVPVATRPQTPSAATEVFREEARGALRAGRWSELARLAENAGTGDRGDEPHGCACGSLAVPVRASVEEDIVETEAASRYGFSPVRLEARENLRRFMGCRCALSPRPSDEPLTDEPRGKPSATCACREHCRDVGKNVLDALDFLKHRAFLTSLGTRYLPLFDAEAVLVETFPDADTEPGPLLERLRLSTRLGLSRLEVDGALAAHGAAAVEEMSLNPVEYVLMPVPFDVYLRAAPAFGWGTRPWWTHLDGYQVLRGWRLRALAGGNARYGGAANLCSIGREDPRDGLLLRLAVLRRRRFVAPAGDPTPALPSGGHH